MEFLLEYAGAPTPSCLLILTQSRPFLFSCLKRLHGDTIVDSNGSSFVIAQTCECGEGALREVRNKAYPATRVHESLSLFGRQFLKSKDGCGRCRCRANHKPLTVRDAQVFPPPPALCKWAACLVGVHQS